VDPEPFSWFHLGLVIFLILANGFFVAAEFAVVKIRPTKVEELVKAGSKRANFVKKVLTDLENQLAAAQLGITLTSLGIGWVSEPTFAAIVLKAFESFSMPETVVHTLSFILAFVFATYLHITIGEQVPKMLAIQSPEKTSLATAPFLYGFSKITYIFIRFIKISTDIMLKPFGVRSMGEHETHSAEEIKMIVSNSQEMDPDQQKILKNVFEFGNRIAREIMVHRKEMDCIYVSDPIDEIYTIVRESKHSRFPVCVEDRDDIIGYVVSKDLYEQERDSLDIRKLVREIPRILETTPIRRTLTLMQKAKQPIAIVTDEYGGVSGLITIEDILEEIVGDIQDEFDEEEESFVQAKDGIVVEGYVLISDVNEELALSIEEQDGIDTIGGYIATLLEQNPDLEDKLIIEHYEVVIVTREEQVIDKLKFIPLTKQEEE
jgi:CBS domain containing-hemolysin-like protein